MKKLWTFFKTWGISLLGILLFFVIISQISWNDFKDVISSVELNFLLIAILIGYFSTILRTIRYWFFFPAPGRRVSLYGTFAFLRMMHYVMPFNSGEAVYLSVLKKYKFSPSVAETVPTWIFLRVTDILALSLWTILGILILPFDGKFFEITHSLQWIFTGITVVLIVIIFTIPYWISRIPLKISNSWLKERVAAFISGLNRTSGFNSFFRTLIVAIIIWAAIILSTVFAQLSFNTPLSLSECFIASIIILCITLLPINPPLGVGTGDAAWAGVMILAGINSQTAISIAIGLRIFSILSIISEGLIGFIIILFSQNKAASENYQTTVHVER